MKKIALAFIATIATVSPLNAQYHTLYDANKLMNQDLNGTARFVSMGGAFGALGGDITTMSINPAGIGLYRSNEFVGSFSLNNNQSTSKFNGSTTDTDKTKGSFDNIGFVFSYNEGRQSSLKYLNLGVNVRRVKSFDRSMSMKGNLGNLSQTDQMASMTNGLSLNDFNSMANGTMKKPYEQDDIAWLSVMGAKTGLVKYDGTNEQGNTLYTGLWNNQAEGSFISRESGSIYASDINLSGNFGDQIYLGATLGVYDVSYKRYSSYSETTSANGPYTLQNWAKTEGSGFNIKLGTIIKPTPTSPLRFGAAIHTPTYYDLTDYQSARLKQGSRVEDTLNETGDLVTEYQFRTPWKYNLSLGYIVGKSGAIGVEYEYEDYTTARYKDLDGYNIDSENSGIKEALKAVNTLRIGGEYRVIPQFSVRAGYSYSGAAFQKDAYKNLPYNSMRTDTEFSNVKGINNYTMGIGMRGKYYFFDAAFQYTQFKEEFFAFDHKDLQATKVDNIKTNLLLTLGYRF